MFSNLSDLLCIARQLAVAGEEVDLIQSDDERVIAIARHLRDEVLQAIAKVVELATTVQPAQQSA